MKVELIVNSNALELAVIWSQLIGKVLRCVETSKRFTKADALLHEGTIPESASRLTTADVMINVGHGLRGLLPSIPGT
eukprot:2064524-Amphidinium_carterae.1